MEFSDDEKWLLQHILETGGADYDVWPAIDERLMPILNELEDRDVIAIMGDGDIRIINKEVERQICIELGWDS